MQALLPAVAPEARRYLREVQAGTRGVAQQQRALRELASFSVKSEKARVHADKERTRLTRLAAQQGQALVVSAHRIHTMREAMEDQKAKLKQEQEKSKALERGLRAMQRAQQQQHPQKQTQRAAPAAAGRHAASHVADDQAETDAFGPWAAAELS